MRCIASAYAEFSRVASVRGLDGLGLVRREVRVGVVCSMMWVSPFWVMVNWVGERVEHFDCRVWRSMVIVPLTCVWCHGGLGMSTIFLRTVFSITMKINIFGDV